MSLYGKVGIYRIFDITNLNEWKHIRKYDVCAVRGPLTRSALLDMGYDCSKIYGDLVYYYR